MCKCVSSEGARLSIACHKLQHRAKGYWLWGRTCNKDRSRVFCSTFSVLLGAEASA